MPRQAVQETSPSSHRSGRVLSATCLAHLVHDGLSDMLYVFFPIWQQLFSLSLFQVGLLKTLFSGATAAFQIPAGKLGTRLGLVPTLVSGTIIASLALISVSWASHLAVLGGLLLLGGIGSSAQHPLGSSAIAGAFSGNGRRAALSAYNFIGDVGKLMMPGIAAFLIARFDWQTTIRFLGFCALASGAVVAVSLSKAGITIPGNTAPEGQPPSKTGFALNRAFTSLCVIGVLDSTTRAGLLTFLPFLLREKGAEITTIGLALGLLFAGGAAGKLACGLMATRIGVLRSVIVTEAATAAGILGMVFLPLNGDLALCPFLGVFLNGTSSVLYGSVPELVDASARNDAFALFYTVGIGAGAASPFLYGMLGDAVGVSLTLKVVAVMVLATLPFTLPLRGQLAR